MTTYYVAVCKVCKWQWAIKSEEREIAANGCPACRAGKNSIVIKEETRDSSNDD